VLTRCTEKHKLIKVENVFVSRIKTNTVFKTVKELELPKDKDQGIIKDDIMMLLSNKAIKTGISELKLRLVPVYKAEQNKGVKISTN
tara:strand:+ start:2958 stop:3218 length:261 start_codon:yes stop_codon:yes gene_type:complete